MSPAKLEVKRDVKFSKPMDKKIAQIQELRTFLLKSTKDLHTVKDILDRFYTSFTVVVGIAKSELTTATNQIIIPASSSSATSDVVDVIKKTTVTHFGKLSSHLSSLFDAI